MKERAILFSAPMIRALLGGTKTQTRRIMKPQPTPTLDSPGDFWWPCNKHQSMVRVSTVQIPEAHGMAADACPHGAHGDRLWVRETFYAYGRWETHFSAKKKRDEWHFADMTQACDRTYQYAADNPDVPLAKGRGGALLGWHKRPAIFMPRAAYRILLDITSVRVERLNDCSEADARAEGVIIEDRHMSGYCSGEYLPPAVRAYRDLWESINGAGSWVAGPWVWAIEFKRVAP